MSSGRLTNATSLFAAVVAASTSLGFSACGGNAVRSIPSPAPSATTISVPMGVDYGLKRQCVRTPFPSEPNFYVDNIDCPGGAYPTSRYWLTNAAGGPPCVGGSDQSVLINGPGSTVTQNWRGNSSAGYAVEMKIDYTHVANPCPPPTWTETALFENVGFGGGLFPRPDEAVLQFDATYNTTFNGAGATHASVEAGSLWNVAGSSYPIHVSLEVELWDNPNALGCGDARPGLPPDVICWNKSTSPDNHITYYGVVLDGSKLNPPIQTPPGVPTHVVVKWGNVIAHALAEHLFPPPVNGWADTPASNDDSVVGFEVRNDVVGTGGPMADLVISNYQLSALVSYSAK
jgi:hypothetical protein